MTTETLLIEVNSKGARVVKRQIDGIAKSSNKADSSVGLLKKSLAGLGIGLGLSKGVQILRSFGQEMSTVKAITQATDAQFASLRDRAKGLGATTRFSATQAAEGMSFLARAGFKTDAILGSIEGTLQLAQSGALDLASAADIASNVLTGFRLDVKSAGRVVDVLAKTANSANTNVLQLGEAMKFAAPVAAGLEVSVENSAAAIGVLSDAGLQGEMAGTGLRTAMIALQNPTSQAAEVLRELGLTSEDVNIKHRGLIPVMKTLAEAGLDVTQAIQIAGVRGGPALEILTKSTPRLETLAGALDQAGGSAEQMSKVMDDNLNGAVLSLVSASEAAVISLGDLGSTNALTAGIRAAAKGIRGLADNMDLAVKAVTALASAFVILNIQRIITGFTAATAAVKLFTAALLTNPVGAIAATLAVVISTLAIFSGDIKIFGDDLTTLADLGVGAFQVIGESVDFLLKEFKPAFDFMGDVASGFFGGVVAESSNAASLMGSSFKWAVDGIMAAVNSLIGLFVGAYNAIEAIFKNIGTVMLHPIDTAIVLIANSLNGLYKTFTNILNKIIRGVNSLGGLFGNTIQELEAFQIELPAGIDKDVLTLGEDISKAFTDGLNGKYVEDFASGLLTTVGDVFTSFADRAKKIAADRALQPIEIPDTIKSKPLPGTPTSDPIGGGGSDATAGRANSLERINDALSEELGLYEGFGRAATIKQGLLDIELSLREEGVALSETEKTLFKNKLNEIEQLKTKQSILERIKGTQEEIANQLSGLGGALDLGEITGGKAFLDLLQSGLFNFEGTQTQLDAFVEQHRQAFEQIDLMVQNKLINEQTANQLRQKEDVALLENKLSNQKKFFGLAKSENSKLAAIGKAAAITQATIDGVLGVQKALASFPPPLNFAMAAAVGVVAAENVAQIASQRRLGGDLNEGQLSRVGEGSRPEVFKTSATGEQFFIPPERGKVTPLTSKNQHKQGQEGQVAAAPQQAPAPIINSINVVDMSMVGDYLQTEEGQEAYLNFISSNPEAVKERLGLG